MILRALTHLVCISDRVWRERALFSKDCVRDINLVDVTAYQKENGKKKVEKERRNRERKKGRKE